MWFKSKETENRKIISDLLELYALNSKKIEVLNAKLEGLEQQLKNLRGSFNRKAGIEPKEEEETIIDKSKYFDGFDKLR